MKRNLKGLLLGLACLTAGITGVDAATATKNINKAACEQVYTNYYLFLDANTKNYMSSTQLYNIIHTTKAQYDNNNYQVYFDKNNVGYGQITVSTTSKTNGLTSMSLDDYYTHFLRAANNNGDYTDGTNSYFSAHSWYRIEDGKWVDGGSGIDVSGYTKTALKNASLNADVDFDLVSTINPDYPRPFAIEIERTYKGSLTNKPLGDTWYLQPAVYYVQYCATAEDVATYKITYHENGNNVSNMPSDSKFKTGECGRLSGVKPSRPGYKFLGWSRDPYATKADTMYSGESDYCVWENLDLYAVWQSEDSYTVTYLKNTDDTVYNMPANETININNNVAISSAVPSRNGYTFLGWSTVSNATNADANFQAGTVYTDRKNLVLYAVWKKNGTALPTNPQTGVEDYLVPFGGAALIAGAGLTVLKKKKAYKQF